MVTVLAPSLYMYVYACYQIFASSCTRGTDESAYVIITAASLARSLSGLIRFARAAPHRIVGRNACIYYRLIECRFESDDTTTRMASYYRRPWQRKIGTAIKNTRDNRLDYLLIRSALVPYKIALTSPFRPPHCEKMNLIFRLIARDREKSETRPARSPLWRYNAQRRHGLFMTERAKFMCNMWRIVSRSLRPAWRGEKNRSFARARTIPCAVDKNIRREGKKKMEQDRNITTVEIYAAVNKSAKARRIPNWILPA